MKHALMILIAGTVLTGLAAALAVARAHGAPQAASPTAATQ